MSSRSAFPLSLIVALGAGALLGLSAATQRDRLPALVGPRPTLEGAQPFPAVEIALGVDLAATGGSLRSTVEQVPQAIRENLGFAPTQLGFKEDLSLEPDAYVIRLRGLAVASGKVRPNRLLALRTLEAAGGDDVPGEATVEPVTGRHGVWITEEDAGRARLFGYDVLEPAFALALHVDKVLRRHLYELLTREETYRLLDRAKQTAPRTVEELTGRLEVGLVQKVLQNLLREQVSLRDLPQVLELLADAARDSQEPQRLTETVRTGLSRQITSSLAGEGQVLHALSLGGRGHDLREARADEPRVKELVTTLRRQLDDVRSAGIKPVLLAPAELRFHVRRLLERELPDLPVLSELEVDPGYRVEPLNTPAEARS
ncbi:MAG TPA: FHIPEP family type III secretion protein [Oscillatoriaceae cyanobacterium]